MRKGILLVVCSTAAVLLICGALIGLWSAREMKRSVTTQFNEEQLILARHISSSIERALLSLAKELSLLTNEVATDRLSPESQRKAVQRSLSRILEYGVWKIEIVDPENGFTQVHTPHGHWSEKAAPVDTTGSIPDLREIKQDSVWVSPSIIKNTDLRLIMAAALAADPPRLLLVHMNLSWFLSPFMKGTRSDKTGYAWLVDENGIFLFHPDSEFVGKSAFEARVDKNPNIPFEKIHAIQRDMIEGREGCDWFYSGWHRGITGQIRKLIAYCPVDIPQSFSARNWSVAVVAPISELDGVIQEGYVRQSLFQGLVVLVILLGVLTIVFFEMRWSRVLEKRVQLRTAALKKSEERYRSLVESAEDFIFSVDAEGNFQSVNSFTATFFGSRPDEFLGKQLSTQFPLHVAERQLQLIKLVYQYKKSLREEFELKTGEHGIWISANFMPLRNEDGEVSAVLCIARDVTENKALERQLVNAEKLASLGTLAAGVAHEVNNPLGVMLGFCDLLLRQTQEGTQPFEDLKTIERQGLHCKQVVENLLSFARLERGAVEYAELNNCLMDIIHVVNHTLDMKHIELHLKLGEDLPRVKGDPRQLQQVFLNLINNAVAAMENGGALKIRTLAERGRRKAIIQFQDTGTGIKEEDLDHIFEPFFTTKPEGEGTGLGLFVSYGIISKYGGTMDCVSRFSPHSDNKSGTTFTIKLLTWSEET